MQTACGQSIQRILRLLTRTGYLIEAQGMNCRAEADSDRVLATLQAAACTYRIALGPRAGHKVLSLQTVPADTPIPRGQAAPKRIALSAHAAVRCGAHQRKELERLCRYITRPAIANEWRKTGRNRANSSRSRPPKFTLGMTGLKGTADVA